MCETVVRDCIADESATGIKRWFGTGFKSKERLQEEEDKQYEIWNEERQARGMKPLEKPERKESSESKK